MGHLPVPLALWAGRRLGDVLWGALPRRRTLTLDNLARAFGPGSSRLELRRLGRSSFENVGMNIAEACSFFFRPTSVLLSRVEFSGLAHLEAARAHGRGVLVLTAHYGNWELLAAAHALVVFPLSVVVRPLDDPVADRIVERFRHRSGVELIEKRRGLRDILDALKRGRMVGILLDQNASRSEGVFVPFFGIPASTSRGLAVIALRTGAPVVPIYIRRLAGGRHRVEIGPAIPAPPDGDVTRYTAAFTQSIEAVVRRDPEQWFWMHDRWKTRPGSEAP